MNQFSLVFLRKSDLTYPELSLLNYMVLKLQIVSFSRSRLDRDPQKQESCMSLPQKIAMYYLWLVRQMELSLSA